MSAKPKKGKTSVVAEKFLAPDVETLEMNEDILFRAAQTNDYATICGALDAKDHPLTAYMFENNLFNKRNEFGKSFCDLAAYLGNKDFIRLILERMGDKLDESTFSTKQALHISNNYNFMHYACVWGKVDLCKFLIDSSKPIADPTDPNSEVASTTNTKDKDKANLKPMGSILLKLKTKKTQETPLDLARRYNHTELIEFLTYAEKRQMFVEFTSEIKQFTNDPEKNLNKLSKDDKKKLEKLYVETLDWIEKNKLSVDVDIGALEVKMKDVNGVYMPIVDSCRITASRMA